MNEFEVSLLGGSVAITGERSGEGRPVLLLHGGAGPRSMKPLLSVLPERSLILPTHPGFEHTRRPEWLGSIRELSLCYLALLDRLQLSDVIVVGNSIGGWIAAEMAARRSPLIAGVVLMGAVGMKPTSETGPVFDPNMVAPGELIKRSFADPARALVLMKDGPPAPENQRALAVYAGAPLMHDPTLIGRLCDIEVPTRVIWGSHDGIVSPAYGKVLAFGIPGASFHEISQAGHLPQVEQPEAVAAIIRAMA